MAPRSSPSPAPPTGARPPTEEGSEAFPAHFEQASQGLRGAIVELLTSVEADPDRPQGISRRFGINKNLAWKVARIARASDATELAPHVPGAAGIRILLEAFARHGAPAPRVDAVQQAFYEWDAMVRTHAGDRKSLDLLLASLHPERVQAERLEAARRLAFEGNSTILGVQARLRLGVQLMAPNAEDPSWLDLAALGGVFDFARLRPTGRWPLLRIKRYGVSTAFPGDPLDADAGERLGIPLLPDHCRGELPELSRIQLEDETLFELGDGPVGQSAAISCVFGWSHRRFAPVHATKKDEVGEHFLRLDAPVERVHFDLLVHRDLTFFERPGVQLHSLMQGPARYPLVEHPEHALPFVEELRDLHGVPPVLATPHVPDLTGMVELAARALGYELDEFRAYRFELRYPPIPAIISLHHPLPVAPP